MNFVDTKKMEKINRIDFCANSLSWYYTICMMPIFFFFVYTLTDHTFDHTVVDNYHMYSLYSQWDDIIMHDASHGMHIINFVIAHRETRSPCPVNLTQLDPLPFSIFLRRKNLSIYTLADKHVDSLHLTGSQYHTYSSIRL